MWIFPTLSANMLARWCWFRSMKNTSSSFQFFSLENAVGRSLVQSSHLASVHVAYLPHARTQTHAQTHTAAMRINVFLPFSAIYTLVYLLSFENRLLVIENTWQYLRVKVYFSSPFTTRNDVTLSFTCENLLSLLLVGWKLVTAPILLQTTWYEHGNTIHKTR